MKQKTAVFWAVAPRSMVEIHRRFRGVCCPLSSGRWPFRCCLSHGGGLFQWATQPRELVRRREMYRTANTLRRVKVDDVRRWLQPDRGHGGAHVPVRGTDSTFLWPRKINSRLISAAFLGRKIQMGKSLLSRVLCFEKLRSCKLLQSRSLVVPPSVRTAPVCCAMKHVASCSWVVQSACISLS
jgi:hypothetical protein